MINHESWLKWRLKIIIISIPAFFIFLGVIGLIVRTIKGAL